MNDYYSIDQEKISKDFCADVMHILDKKFTKEILQKNEETTQTKEEVFIPLLDDGDLTVLADFIISWYGRKCDCLIKSHCDKLPALIQVYLQHVPSVLISIWRQLLQLNDTSTCQEVANTRLHLLKKFQVISFATIKCFIIHFTLYQVKKLRNLELLEEEQLYVKTDPSVHSHTLMLRNVYTFCHRARGFEMIATIFRDESQLSSLPLLIARELCTILISVRLHLTKCYLVENIPSIRPLVYSYLNQLADTVIRDNKYVISQIISSVMDPLERGPSFDLDILGLALKYIRSSILILKLEGLASLNAQLYLFLDWKSKGFLAENEQILAKQYTNWIINNEIVERVLGRSGQGSFHPEMLKISHVLLQFLATNFSLTTEHVDALWEDTKDKHCSRQVFLILSDLSKTLEEDLVRHLLGKLTDLQVDEHSVGSLQLCYSLIRAHWCNIQSAGLFAKTGVDRQLPGVVSNLEAMLNTSERSSSSSVASTEVQIPEDTPGQDNELDLETIGMDTEPEEQTSVNFPENSTPPLCEDIPVVSEDKVFEALPGDKSEPMERQSSDTTQSYSLDPWEHDDTPDPIFSIAKQLPTVDSSSDAKPAKSLVDHLNTNGNSIIWELLQDENISKLSVDLREFAQTQLADVIKQTKFSEVVQHFMRACVVNISQDKSVIFSLNLLLSLLSSPPSIFSGNYCAFSWAQKELNMMDVFFQNWRRFMLKVEGNEDIDLIHTTPKHLDARLDFLSTLVSHSFPAKAFTLTCEAVEEIWESLVVNTKLQLILKNKGFTWFDLQVTFMPQKIIAYLVQNKVSDLDPRTIPLAGFSLVRRLFPYSTPHLSCADNPCLELVWNIAMHHFDNQISKSAIEFLNISFFSRIDSSLCYEESFLKRSLKFLAEGLDILDTTKDINNVISPNTFESKQLRDTNTSAAFTLVRRGLELLVSHLNLFQERFSFHIRMWRLRDKPLERHCEERFPGLTELLGLDLPLVAPNKGDCMKVYLVYTGYNDTYKTTLELSSCTLLAELRAETVFCLNKAGKTKMSSCSSEQSFYSVFPPLKLTSDGQLLQYESDTKTLKELDIKENSILQVSHTSVASSIPGSTVSPSLLPTPKRKSIPHNLLVELEAIPFLLRLATAVHEHGNAMSTMVWKLLAILPTSPKEIARATSAISEDTNDWEKIFGNLSKEQNLFEQLYCLQALQTVLLRASEDNLITPGIRRSGLIICIARLSTHMEFCLSINSPSSEPSSLESLDKENVSPSIEGSIEGWSCWHQAVLCYWIEILCVLCLHRVMLQDDSSGSDSDDLILDVSQDCVVQSSSGGKRTLTPRFELEMPKVTVDIIQENNINMLSLLSRALELGSAANSECASILSNRAWALIVCWCQSNRYALLALLNRKDFSSLAEKLLLHCQVYSVRKLARRSLKQLYSEFKDPSISLTLLENLLHCSIDNATLLELSHNPPQETNFFLNPLQFLSHPSEQLLRQSGECFLCIYELIIFVYNSKRYKKNWKSEECYEHACYERLITRAPYEVIELITERHCNRDTMDTPDVFLKGLLHIMTALTKLSTDYTSSDQAKVLVDRLLANLFPFKKYNPSDGTQSPLPVYCNSETRVHAVDLLEAMVFQNPKLFPQIAVVLRQNHPVLPGTPWEYRPRDDLRDVHTGYCGISNLGATCYMASTLQQLYMIPPLRNAILAQDPSDVTPRHSSMFRELQRLFLHLWQSRRATYNPEKFCAEYIFDQHQLNPLEQRDMNEFFTDLLSKLEDISYLLKKTVKGLFGGVIANVVMSNECSHVSRNCEDFYSVRAKVADMPDLQASLQELTQTDILDGENRYTCSQCGVSVRAEKRACFAQLPSILCINTMRYTFNLSTNANEKVNTHYPFPLELDMRSFIESSNVTSYIESQDMDITADPDLHCTKYVLVGVVVHTGTAEGGHYYTILQKRDDNSNPMGRWYMFNDQLVTEFDPQLIGLECFGGEIPNSTVDQHTRRIFPGLLERNNSAYMLFYQRKDFRSEETIMPINPVETARPVLLENNKFLREVYTFDLHYLQAVWKMCRHCRQDSPLLLVSAVKVATQVLLATIIHAKDRPNVRKCFEWLTTQYREYPELCTTFLEYLCGSHENNWVLEMFYLCPIKSTEDLFVNLLLTMLQSIKKNYTATFYSGFPKVVPEGDTCNVTICESSGGNNISVTTLIKNVVEFMCINELLPNSNDFSPYFDFLCHFALMGLEECKLLTTYHVVQKIDMFYSRATRQAHHPSLTFEEGILSLVYDDPSYHPDSLTHFLNTLLNYLLADKLFSKEDSSALLHKPGYPLLTQLACSQADRQATYHIYIRIWQENRSLCPPMLDALFAALSRESRHKCCNIYLLLNMMVMVVAQPDFRTMVLTSLHNNIRQVFTAASLPYTIDFLSMVLVHPPLHDWVLKQKGEWLASWLIEYEDFNVRKKTATLIYNLVPCSVFREYAVNRRQESIKDLVGNISEAGREFLYELVDELLQLLPLACEISARCDTHDGLVQYFQVLEKCSVGESECELLEKYFNDFWKLYHPRIGTASVECHEDKCALFSYFLHTCIQCPSNIQCLLDHSTAPREISVIYILANNDKNDVVKYNCVFLEKYYTVLRLACEKSPSFVRDLSTQSNTFWALQNILPFYNLTPNAVEELYKMMNLIAKLPSAGSFRRKAISNCLDTVLPTNAKTLRKVLKSLIRCEEDAMKAFTSGGLVKLSDAYLNLFSRLNDSNHIPSILSELNDLLSIVELILKTVYDSTIRETCSKEQLNCWNECRNQFIETIAHTLNSFVYTCHRQLALQILDLSIKLYPYDVTNLLLPILSLKHAEFYKIPNKIQVPVGQDFPRIRPNQDVPVSTPEPMLIRQFNMFINETKLAAEYGVDPLYDHALKEFYRPYHEFVKSICEVDINYGLFQAEMIRLSCLTALEGLVLRLDVLPNLILVIKTLPQKGEARIIDYFYENKYFVALIKAMLFDYNCVLMHDNLYKFCFTFYPKVKKNISSEYWNSFFQITSEEFSDLESEPGTHMNAMKTLEIYLKNNTVESLPLQLVDNLSLYCIKHLNEEFVLCMESPRGTDEVEKTPENVDLEDHESNVKERKRPTLQNTDPTPPKRKKIDSNINQDITTSETSLPSQTMETATDPSIEMLRSIQELLRH